MAARPAGDLLGLPGRSRLEQIALLCDIEDYESAMRKADTVTRVISGNIEEATTARPATLPRSRHEVPSTGRPAFQVLVVDDLPEADVTRLRQEMRRLRRAEDPFTYELLFVPTFEDALLAVLLNSEIQACVIRPELRGGLASPAGRYARFIEDFDLAAGRATAVHR